MTKAKRQKLVRRHIRQAVRHLGVLKKQTRGSVRSERIAYVMALTGDATKVFRAAR